MIVQNLFGEEFEIQDDTKKVLNKVKKDKKKSTIDVDNFDIETISKNKKLDIEDKLALVYRNVPIVLSKQVDRVKTVYDKEELHKYIQKAIESGVIAIDTETDNSVDPTTCKLMGVCLFYKGAEKQIYIPINHINRHTRERLSNQLTEQDIYDELKIFESDKKTEIVMHNAKFDYQVLKCKCGLEVLATWDTEIAARLMDENEKANLKTQYALHIDPEQDEYKIEKLFEGLDYDIIDPEVFAIYSATDSYDTEKLYEYQKALLQEEQNLDIYKLFKLVEMPCVEVTANMELAGVEVDLVYAERLSNKYHKLLDKVDEEVDEELKKLEPLIESWRQTKDAKEKPKVYADESDEKKSNVEENFPNKDSSGKHYKIGKSKAEQLESPVNMGSTTQVAILFYDILKVGEINPKKPRGTGEEEMKAIASKTNNPLCKVLLKRRALCKLISTYIDNIPELSKIWDDHRLRFHLNQLGTDTGRFSSGGKLKYRDKNGVRREVSGVNIQNIPSHEKSIRMLFQASDREEDEEVIDNCCEIDYYKDVLTESGWKKVSDIQVGDTLLGDDNKEIVERVELVEDKYRLYLRGGDDNEVNQN